MSNNNSTGKQILSNVLVKVLSTVIIVGLIAGCGYFGYQYLKGKNDNVVTEDTKTDVEIITEKLEGMAELNTGTYLCTSVTTKVDSKKIKGWKIPGTTKTVIVQYDGTIKAGISDLTLAEVTQEGNKIIISLPDVEITSRELDNDSFEVLDESNNIFNPIVVEDLNEIQSGMKDKMEQSAIEMGIYDIARENAEMILMEMFASADGRYEVEIVWK